MNGENFDLSAPWETVKTWTDRPIFLQASAGSGKTYTLERLVLLHLLKGGDLERILGVTFAEKSAQDLRTKIRKTLRKAWRGLKEVREGQISGETWLRDTNLSPDMPLNPEVHEKALKNALDNFNRAHFHTIHGFCRTVLSTYPFEAQALFSQQQGTRDWEDKTARDYLRKILPTLDRSTWKALGADLPVIAQELGDLVGKGWFRHPLPTAQVIPDLGESFHLGKILRALEAELEPGKILDLWLRDLSNIKFLEETELKGLKGLNQTTYKKPYQAVKALGNSQPSSFLSTLFDPAHYDQKNENYYAFKWLGNGEKQIFTRPASAEASEDQRYSLCSQIQGKVEELSIILSHLGAEDFLKMKNPLQDIPKLVFFHTHVPLLEEFLRDRAQAQGILTFDGMIDQVALRLGDKNPKLQKALQARFDLLVIDEFQDTDQKQWSIFRSLFLEGKNLVTVGDPKQGIYGFRGADLQIYLGSRDQLIEKGGKALSLPYNHRSGASLVEGVNQLAALLFDPTSPASQNLEFTPAQAFNTPGPHILDGFPGIEIVSHKPECTAKNPQFYAMVEDAALRMKEILEHKTAYFTKDGVRNLDLGDFALLVDTNFLGRKALEILSRFQIPATLFGKNSLFATPEARDLEIFFRALQNPLRPENLLALGLSPLMSLDLEALTQAQGDGRMILFMDWLRDLSNLAREGRLLEVFLEAFSSSTVNQWFPEYIPLETRILSRSNGERTYTNYAHLMEILQEEFIHGQATLDRVLGYLQDRRLRNPQEEETVLRVDRDTQAVKILTLHGSKGLEFPWVFLCGGFYTKGTRDSKSYREYLKNPQTKAVNLTTHGMTEKERTFMEAENRRLSYVAFTRAQGRLTLPKFYTEKKSNVSEWYKTLPWETLDPKFFHSRDAIGSWLEDYPSLGIEFPPTLELSVPGEPGQGFSYRHPFSTNYTRMAETSLITHNPPLQGKSELWCHAGESWGESPEWMKNLTGKKFGIFYHEVLETMDFSHPLKEEEVRIRAQGYYPESSKTWSTWGKEFIRHTQDFLAHPWPLGKDFNFTRLEPEKIWKELEFHFTISENMGNILGTEILLHPGFLHGFIDLLFEFQGKIYLLDWKATQLLEDQTSPEGLESAMREKGYFLQLAVYWTALQRFLAQYAPHLKAGGVLYAFLRHNLLYSYIPSEGETTQWLRCLGGETHE